MLKVDRVTVIVSVLDTYSQYQCLENTDESLEQDVLDLETVGAQSDLRRVCKLPYHNSGFVFSSNAILKNQLPSLNTEILSVPFYQ